VSLVVRPDSQTPARDPFVFYGRPPVAGLHIEVAPITGPAASRRAGYLTFAIGRAAGRGRQDVIFTRDLGVAALLLRLPRALRAPLVYEAHGIAADVAAALPDLLTGAAKASPAKLQRLARRDERVWRAADGYVTITAALARELERRWGPRELIAVVPDGVRLPTDVGQRAAGSEASLTDVGQGAETPGASLKDVGQRAEGSGTHNTVQSPTGVSSPALGPTRATTEFTIGYAGHLYPWKGVDLVIEAVAALKDTRGLIVGGHAQEPDLARVKALADALDCLPRITFTGLIPPADVAARLRECGVLALPNPASAISREFTSPLKLFEYMASGRPIVASDLPSLGEVLRHEENALLVEPGNPQALVAAIERIRQDPALGQGLARQALEDVRGYTWARRAERLEALFAAATGAAA